MDSKLQICKSNNEDDRNPEHNLCAMCDEKTSSHRDISGQKIMIKQSLIMNNKNEELNDVLNMKLVIEVRRL